MKKGAKKTSKATKTTIAKNADMEKVLIENFVSLQKVLTNLSVKFDNLSDKISKLLEIFEISAKALAEKDLKQLQGSGSKEVVEKLDTLLDQNKTIARGLTMMHEGNLGSRTRPEEPRVRRLPEY